MDYTTEVINISKIKEGFYIGDQIAATNLDVLIQFKLTHMINATGSQICNQWETIGIKYLTLNWSEEPTQNLFDPKDEIASRIVQFIDDSFIRGEGLLAHSVKGQNRVCIVVLIYLMKKFKWNVNKSLEYLRSKKQDVEIPNYFFSQIVLFESRLMKKGEGIKTIPWSVENLADPEERLLRNTYVNGLLSKASNVPRDYFKPKEKRRIGWADTNKKDVLAKYNTQKDLFLKPEKSITNITIHKKVRPSKSCIKNRALSSGDIRRKTDSNNLITPNISTSQSVNYNMAPIKNSNLSSSNNPYNYPNTNNMNLTMKNPIAINAALNQPPTNNPLSMSMENGKYTNIPSNLQKPTNNNIPLSTSYIPEARNLMSQMNINNSYLSNSGSKNQSNISNMSNISNNMTPNLIQNSQIPNMNNNNSILNNSNNNPIGTNTKLMSVSQNPSAGIKQQNNLKQNNNNDIMSNYSQLLSNNPLAMQGNNDMMNNNNNDNNNINNNIRVNNFQAKNYQGQQQPRAPSYDPGVNSLNGYRANYNIGSLNSLNPSNIKNYALLKDNNSNNMGMPVDNPNNNNSNSNYLVQGQNIKDKIIYADKFEHIVTNNINNIYINSDAYVQDPKGNPGPNIHPLRSSSTSNNNNSNNMIRVQTNKTPSVGGNNNNNNNLSPMMMKSQMGIGPIPNIQFQQQQGNNPNNNNNFSNNQRKFQSGGSNQSNHPPLNNYKYGLNNASNIITKEKKISKNSENQRMMNDNIMAALSNNISPFPSNIEANINQINDKRFRPSDYTNNNITNKPTTNNYLNYNAILKDNNNNYFNQNQGSKNSKFHITFIHLFLFNS